jgi:hypothetical protein
MTIPTERDLVILAMLERMRAIPCREQPEAGRLGPDADRCCSCPRCLCAYTAFQVEQGNALLSRYLPTLGCAIVVEITGCGDRVDGGNIVALLAPGKVGFPETRTGWLTIPD